MLSTFVRTLLNSPALLLAALAVYAYFQVWQPLTHLHSNDFKHIYLGTQAIWTHRDPYSAESLLDVAKDYGLGTAALNPYVYLPFTGIALGFLRFFSFPTAAHFWFVTNHMLLFASLILWARTLTPFTQPLIGSLGWLNVLALLAAISHPLSRTFTAGQLNIVLLLCYVVSFISLQRTRDLLAGAVLGFGAMFKLAPGLFALYLLLVQRWRALLAMVATCAALLLVSIAIAGWRMHLAFLPVLAQMGYGKSTWQHYGATFWKDPWNQSLNSLLTHLFVEANHVTVSWYSASQKLANLLTITGSLTMLLLFVFAAFHASRRTLARDPRASALATEGLFFMALLLSLLLPSLLWDHYLILLLLPVSWLVARGIELHFEGLVLGALICYLITAVPIRFDAEHFRHGWGVLLMSSKFYPTLALYLTLTGLVFRSQKPCRLSAAAG
jgi:hypothetical protein